MFSNNLIKLIRDAFENSSQVFQNYISLPINQQTIALDKEMNAGQVEIDYNMVDEIYINKNDLIFFLYQKGVFGSWNDIIENNTPTIALDIDGVLADVATEIKKICPHWNQLEYEAPVDFNDFDYINLYVLDKPKFPIKYIVTSRPYSYKDDTVWWLNNHDIDYNIVFFTDDKLELMTKQGIDILVDDNPQTFLSVNNGGKICYLYDATYNRHIDTHLRIRSLTELQEKLEL